MLHYVLHSHYNSMHYIIIILCLLRHACFINVAWQNTAKFQRNRATLLKWSADPLQYNLRKIYQISIGFGLTYRVTANAVAFRVISSRISRKLSRFRRHWLSEVENVSRPRGKIRRTRSRRGREGDRTAPPSQDCTRRSSYVIRRVRRYCI